MAKNPSNVFYFRRYGLFLCALLGVLLLVGCRRAEAPAPTPADTAAPGSELLRDLGPAPELTNEVWLNVDQPLRLKDLRGKVVLLDMWTFG